MSKEGKRFPFSHCDQEDAVTPRWAAACFMDQQCLRLKFTKVSWKLLQKRTKSCFEEHPLEVEAIARESTTSRRMSQIPLFNRMREQGDHAKPKKREIVEWTIETRGRLTLRRTKRKQKRTFSLFLEPMMKTPHLPDQNEENGNPCRPG